MSILKSRKNIFIICGGAMLEYYDFIIFGLLAPYFAKNFFIQFSSPITASYMLFSVGYFFRPFGGIVLGMVSDCRNREKVFTFVALLTGCSTMMIGILPTNAQSDWPVYSLIFLRICQSVGYGADIPNATTMIYEKSELGQKSFYVSLVIINATVGSLLAFFVLGVIVKLLSEEEMYNYGWRIPLVLGGVSTIAIFFARKTLFNSNNFYKKSSERLRVEYVNFLLKMLSTKRRELLICFFIILSSSMFVITNIYLPNYLSHYFEYSKSDVLGITTFGLVMCIPILFVSGKYLNKYSGRNALFILGALFILWVIFILTIGQFSEIYQVWMFVIMVYLYNCLAVVYGLKITMKLFDKVNRNTSVAIIYNGAFVIASLLPNVTIGLNGWFKSSFALLYVLLFVIASTMFIIRKFIDKKGL